MNAELLNEIERLHAAASPVPWSSCGDKRGGCQCGFVWSEALDTVVAKATTNDADDELPPVAEEQMRANAMLIAKIRNALPELIAAARLQLETNP